MRLYPGCYPGLGASAPSGREGHPVISGHGHFRSFSFSYALPLEKNQTGVSVVESLKRSSADGISSSSNHFFNLS